MPDRASLIASLESSSPVGMAFPRIYSLWTKLAERLATDQDTNKQQQQREFPALTPFEISLISQH
ncbi:hypothetical protein HK100_006134, partial [Physocladia obscura]